MFGFSFRWVWGSLAFGALLAVGACGSRSQLLGPAEESDGGSGGAPGTTTSDDTTTTTDDTTTSTSTTVPEGPCPVLTFATPYSDLDGGLQLHQRSPKLSYSNGSKMRVTLGSGWQAVEGPGPNLPIELRHTSFEPWVDFPAGSGFGPTYLADLDAGVSFAMAPGPGDLLAMLFRDFKQAPAGGLRFASAFKPGTGDVPASILADGSAQDALFLAEGGGKWLYGARELAFDAYETRIGVVTTAGVEAELQTACLLAPGAASAVSIPGGFLAAWASVSEAPASCEAAVPGDVGGITVGRILDGQLASTFFLGGYKTDDVQMAPRAEGAWIVWHNPATSVDPPSIWVAAMSSNGTTVVAPSQVEMFCEPDSMAVASFNDFLMIGCLQAEPEGASPFVQVIDPEGIPRGSIVVPATGAAKGRIALIGSPISHSAVLAWSETAGIGDQIRITRVDCIEQD